MSGRWIIVHDGTPVVGTESDNRTLSWLRFRDGRDRFANMGKFAARMRRLGYRAARAATPRETREERTK